MSSFSHFKTWKIHPEVKLYVRIQLLVTWLEGQLFNHQDLRLFRSLLKEALHFLPGVLSPTVCCPVGDYVRQFFRAYGLACSEPFIQACPAGKAPLAISLQLMAIATLNSKCHSGSYTEALEPRGTGLPGPVLILLWVPGTVSEVS